MASEMRYLSTRGGIAPISFSEAVMMGLARDGGLILPEAIPDVSETLADWKDLSYQDLACKIMQLFVDLPPEDLRELVTKSYSVFRSPDITPVRTLDNIHILELFHGPTLAFKDVALQFLGNLFEYIMARTGDELNILAATSGDTGSAAIHGVKGRKGMQIFVMHPSGKVTRTQELQMTTVPDANVFNIAIDGTFDDCQNIAKALFNDLEFRDRHSLGSVNSINWARVLAQIVYYFYAAFGVMNKTGAQRVRFAVPTGNFGDVLAGYMAARMGLPIGLLVLATNENDILSRFFNSGVYRCEGVRATPSPSMDIQIASNFERYLYFRINENPAQLNKIMKTFAATNELSLDDYADPLFAAGSCDTKSTLETIKRFQAKHNYLLDPHTAVGVNVALQHLDADEPMICLATAHPAKFGKAITDATGEDLAHHPIIDGLSDLPARCERLPASEEAVRDFIRSHCS
jgi:threonine synthase